MAMIQIEIMHLGKGWVVKGKSVCGHEIFKLVLPEVGGKEYHGHGVDGICKATAEVIRHLVEGDWKALRALSQPFLSKLEAEAAMRETQHLGQEIDAELSGEELNDSLKDVLNPDLSEASVG